MGCSSIVPIEQLNQYHMNDTTTKKVLLPHEVQRIEPLLHQYSSRGINFKFFTTINYWYKQKDYVKVLLDNARIRKVIRKFYKANIRIWFFIEKHTDTTSKHCGGYHKHILIEDAPQERWYEPTLRMTTFMIEDDPEMVLGCMNRVEPSNKQKIKLLNKVIRGHNLQVPNSFLGCITKEINDLPGLLSYCTKQVTRNNPMYEVVDIKSSDIDLSTYIRKEQTATLNRSIVYA